MLGGARATVLGGTVDLAETADTDGLAEVDVAGDGGGANVEPVGILGRHLLGGAGLDGVNPTWWNGVLAAGRGLLLSKGLIRTRNGQLSLTLQERSVGVDELVRLDYRKKTPSAIDSVFRSLATPSRLLQQCLPMLFPCSAQSRSRGRPFETVASRIELVGGYFFGGCRCLSAGREEFVRVRNLHQHRERRHRHPF